MLSFLILCAGALFFGIMVLYAIFTVIGWIITEITDS